MPRFKRGKNLSKWNSNRAEAGVGKLRIVGGKFRGRLITYSGDAVTRPMKDNIREALFNLVGGWVKGKVVIDLFAGTGAMGLEALSRGAIKCLFIERHFPTIRLIKENVLSLDSELPVEINSSDTFFWVRKFLKSPELRPPEPWVVFCCPPYAFYVDRQDEVLKLIGDLVEVAPQGSIFVVESDSRFDTALLPNPDKWVVRKYSPALVAVLREKDTGASEESASDENS
ncbi:MAG: 16S rRNA (guanine966-N2)-methyltransferase [Mariniblastus sp.]|jgi:16S rRNA (guanine966-N2)-methyltransferase